VKDILKAVEHPSACKDELGRLRVGAAVGTGDDTDARVEALAAAGVDVIVVDTSHGHSQGVLDRVRGSRSAIRASQVIGGNVATAPRAKALADQAPTASRSASVPAPSARRASLPASACRRSRRSRTRLRARGGDIPIVADGGIRYSGDVAKAIAAARAA
jgi:IMP dehydrogenase